MDPKLTYWKVADVDEDPEIDVTTFGKHTKYGINTSVRPTNDTQIRGI